MLKTKLIEEETAWKNWPKSGLYFIIDYNFTYWIIYSHNHDIIHFPMYFCGCWSLVLSGNLTWYALIELQKPHIQNICNLWNTKTCISFGIFYLPIISLHKAYILDTNNIFRQHFNVRCCCFTSTYFLINMLMVLLSSLRWSRGSSCYTLCISIGVRIWLKFLEQVLYLSYCLSYFH